MADRTKDASPESTRSRRSILCGLGVLPLAGTASARVEPPIAAEVTLVALLARYTAGATTLNDPASPDEFGDGAFAQMMEAVEIGSELASSVRTLAGATVALEWTRALFLDHVEASAGAVDHLDILTLRFIDGALGVLRSIPAGRQVHA